MKTVLLVAAVAAALFFVLSGARTSAAFVPKDDFAVAKVDARPAVSNPNDAVAAARKAKDLIELSRMRAHDPRPLGQAQALLSPWWNDPNAPVEIVVLRATIKQSLHDFEGALTDLKSTPPSAQGILTQATVEMVLSRFDDAKITCEKLDGIAEECVFQMCQAQVNSRSGKLSEAIVQLKSLSKSMTAPLMNLWRLSVLGECEEWNGSVAEAQSIYRQVLAADETDDYTRALLTDSLLESNSVDAESIASGAPVISDGLLLRVVLAQTKRGVKSSPQQDDLAQRFEAMRARGDEVHLRELARYQLSVSSLPQAAVETAKRNFFIQQEPYDALLLLESAIAARDVIAINIVRDWKNKTRFEGTKLNALLKTVNP
jgi:hypothetical protein